MYCFNDFLAHTPDWTCPWNDLGDILTTAMHTNVELQVSMNTALQMQLCSPLQQLHVEEMHQMMKQ